MHHVCMFQVPLTIKGKENAFVLRNRLLLEQSHLNPDVCAVINFPMSVINTACVHNYQRKLLHFNQ